MVFWSSAGKWRRPSERGQMSMDQCSQGRPLGEGRQRLNSFCWRGLGELGWRVSLLGHEVAPLSGVGQAGSFPLIAAVCSQARGCWVWPHCAFRGWAARCLLAGSDLVKSVQRQSITSSFSCVLKWGSEWQLPLITPLMPLMSRWHVRAH